MSNEQADHDDCGKTVNVPCGFVTTKQSRKECRPTCVRELQRHPRERKAHEADDHEDVQRPVETSEAKELLLFSDGGSGGRCDAGASVMLAGGVNSIKPSILPGVVAFCFSCTVLRGSFWIKLLVRSSPHLQCTGKPEQRMYTAKHERADQQRRHPPECPEEKWIFCRVVVGCVCKVAGKPSRCTFMALLTCPHDIIVAEMRLRIGNGKNIVRAVAIVALGCLCVAQLGDLAVIRIEIRLCNVFVAPSALRHDIQLESGFICTADRVRTMTITADGKWLVGLSYFDVVDTLLELFLDPVMTSSTRCREHFSD